MNQKSLLKSLFQDKKIPIGKIGIPYIKQAWSWRVRASGGLLLDVSTSEDGNTLLPHIVDTAAVDWAAKNRKQFRNATSV